MIQQLQKQVKHVIRQQIDRTGYQILSKKEQLFPWSELRAFFQEKSLHTVFDVGANVGQTVRKIVEYYPKANIYSFEPDPKSYQKLQERTAHLSNVRVYNIGLGEHNENKELLLTNTPTGNSFLAVAEEAFEYSPGDWLKLKDKKEVSVCRLDTFCQDNNISSIDLLKIDTQGYELKVLKGGGDWLSPKTVKTIYLEVNFVTYYQGQASFLDIFSTLLDKGYKFVDFYDKHRKAGSNMYWCNALFIG
jgi:FkbM family methyltransferase